MKITARIEGAGKAAKRSRNLAAQLPADLARAVNRLGERGQEILRRHAPKKSGNLRQGIVVTKGIGARPVAIVTGEAESKEGFNYLRVTRFGHRVKYIYPKQAKALRFELGGKVVFARRVRGYKPSSDWVDEATPEIRAAAQEVQQQLRGQVARRIAR